MQRVANLFPEMCSFGNLLLAYRKTRAGSRKTAGAAEFAFFRERELLRIRDELLDGSWQPGPFHFFGITDPKPRTIAVAPFRDRVMHHAIVNVLEPVWERRFIADSFATRKGKGVHAAVARAQVFLRENDWFLKTDVEKFFDSVNHDIMLDAVGRVVKDRKLLDVAEKIVRHGGENGLGLPIGNRTSQFFANVYLHPFDLFVKQTLRPGGYVRYMDDFVLFHDDKAALKTMKAEAEQYLRERLGLVLKPSATFFNSPQNGLSFLGTRIFPGIIRLRNENLRRITRRMAVKEKYYAEGMLDEQRFLESMNSYWALLSYYPLPGLRNSLLGFR